MQREIKFRGKQYQQHDWIFGGIKVFADGTMNIITEHEEFSVIEESVGEFTGLKDKNGVDIYEGDILRYPIQSSWDKINFVCFEVFWHDNDCAYGHIGFQLNRVHLHGSMAGYGGGESMLPRHTKKMIIIGNIYENPELLNTGGKGIKT